MGDPLPADLDKAIRRILQEYTATKVPQPREGGNEVPIEQLAALIKRLRLEQGLSQRELAHLAGLSIGPVLQLEKNIRTTSLENTEKILNVLGKSLVVK